MSVYDCFYYFNETDVVRMRLEELKDVVEYVVVIEADHTFSGIEKPFYFDGLPKWVDQFKDKIIRLQISFPKNITHPWHREAFQRNQLMEFINELEDDDIILISDADEIPRANIIEDREPSQLDVVQYFWNLNWRVPDHCNQGARPTLCKKRDMTTPQKLREAQLPRIPYGGWHFSFFDHFIQNKLEAFSHTEYNKEEFKEVNSIAQRISCGIDPFDRFPLKYSKVDATYPQWVQDNITSLSHLLL